MILKDWHAWPLEGILDALYAKKGSLEVGFLCEIIRNGSILKKIDVSGSISYDRDAQVTRIARLQIKEELDWLKDQLQPYMILRMEDARASSSYLISWETIDFYDWSFYKWDAQDRDWEALETEGIRLRETQKQYARFPLGTFIPSTPKRSSVDGVQNWLVEAYDRSVILKEDTLTETLYFPEETMYLIAIKNVLASAGIENVMFLDESEARFPAEREFEIGEKKINIVNTLLDEINFTPIYCDENGEFIVQKYKEPNIAKVNYSFMDDQLSITSRDTKTELDYYNVPNVFIATCSNPDIDEDYISVWENNNPASGFSTVQRGRRIISKINKVNMINSQDDLDDYVKKIAFEASQVYEPVIFYTMPFPIHGREDVVLLHHPDINGVYVQNKWILQLEAGGLMTHTAKRVVKI